MPKIKLIWSPEAKLDLQRIRRYIAKDAPRRATEYIKKLRKTAALLRKFPELGGSCPELEWLGCRELIKGNYRIIYRVQGKTVQVITVRHAARLLGEDFLDE
jgi:addiction module RelE/StbE family toxin